MEIGGIQLWQVPLLAMAAVALAEWAVGAVLRRWSVRVDWRLARALGFGAAVLVASVLLLVNYLSEADKLANIISAVAAVATLWLTRRAFQRPARTDPPARPESRPTPEDAVP
ncbi:MULTISPECIES: hypothetical protein [Micromonospora]|uniref:Uncharacterized protein n=1 Tax=Micromonospora solifontis TaxID=2487138 RepID=A0ABX9WK39_9ACTN|nr:MULTISPECIES: hypothetical protein [Micromonospora]NES13771.1 hypothetical protein [Micromonospora sp. PPF5-17B]NES35562.1 hypothetical protein [Micromonospora solifontis]NES55952.1 hypothetical protein [Micromonospora sp. PPF5-6]RNM00616.1 hypothetical protein EFE23_05205 [Micromonospora solifontis]